MPAGGLVDLGGDDTSFVVDPTVGGGVLVHWGAPIGAGGDAGGDGRGADDAADDGSARRRRPGGASCPSTGPGFPGGPGSAGTARTGGAGRRGSVPCRRSPTTTA